jgi:UDP-N-acetylmuramoyl-tripeptide--D-alanyl-D-alanine ligase
VAFNRLENHISAVVRTLRTAPKDTEFVVMEVSAGNEPKIEKVARLIAPDVVVVTMVRLEHHKTFRTCEAVAHEKGHLVAGLKKDGIALLNFDDPLVMRMSDRTEARVVTFGRGLGADYVAEDVRSSLDFGLQMSVRGKGKRVTLTLKLYGEHFYLPVLAAVACALELGIPPPEIEERMADFEGYSNRCGVIRMPNGPVFVVDTCKSPDHSVTLPMDFIAEAHAIRKTIVLGQISDYAGNSNRVYKRAAKYAVGVADRVILTGPNSHKARLPEEEIAGKILRIPDVHEVADFLKRTSLPGEIILLKSSQNIHLERAYLAFQQQVLCRVEECGRESGCISCGLAGLPFSEHPRREHERRPVVKRLRAETSRSL